MPDAKKKELAKIEKDDTDIQLYTGPSYAVCRHKPEQLKKIFEANLSEEDIDTFDLERIHVPTGGGLSWTVSDSKGEPMPVEEIEGVVLMQGLRRAFWKTPFDQSGGGSPPDCSSVNGIEGWGTIRGEDSPEHLSKSRICAKCPMADWGSRFPEIEEDNQQACSQRKFVFFLAQDRLIPRIVDLPPTSVKPFKQFMTQMTSLMIPHFGAVIGLKLRNDKSRTGITYSVVQPRLIGTFNEEECEIMEGLKLSLKPIFMKAAVTDIPPDMADPSMS
jgi:hypothetical protein